jgi:tRNA 5-methylaminomethyl-2-thiouridine biosynthesis bifunctional protein
LLDHPLIGWCGGQEIEKLIPCEGSGWQVCNAKGDALGTFPHVALAMGPSTNTLLEASLQPAKLPLQAIRGQVSWGLNPCDLGSHWPQRPVNGHGSFVGSVPTAQGPAWFVGSIFDRHSDRPQVRAEDHAENRQRLAELLPEVALRLKPQWEDPRTVHGWSGIRCTVPDRLPLVGPLDPGQWPGLHVVTGLGARGLTLGLLCAEVLASQLNGDPSPVTRRHAKALSAQRFGGYMPSSYTPRTKK